MRDSLTSYLFPFSPHPSSTHTHRYLDTPPMSHTDSSFGNERSLYQSHSMPLTPVSPPSNHLISLAADHSAVTCPSSPTSAKPPQPIIPLLAALFPYQATHASARAHSLEIITPPSTILHGFYIDSESTGRTVYVHLPPLPADQLSTGLSVRDSITALLDLAETLHGSHLVLVLDRDERDDQSLADLLHSLLYVGMEMCKEVPGRYEFDARQWLLLGIEL